jgi:putative ABC transport system permease protein
VDFKEVARVALRALARNKMRTALTMLGIIIGVAAVICTVAIGQGASERVQEAIRNLGSNLVWVEAGNRNVSGVRTGTRGTKSLTIGDARAIKQQVPLITLMSPQVDTGVQVVYGNQNWSTQVRGVSPEYITIRRWQIERGTMFTENEVEGADDVCVLGATVARFLFPDEDPIGKSIRVKNLPCRVIGVFAPKGQSATGQDQDDMFLMPWTAVQRKVMGITWLDDIMLSAASDDAIAPAEEQIMSLLRERHHIRQGEDEDFNLRHPVEIAQAVADSARVMKLLLVSIASVSLAVGGIGIMNIMLVSVTERTREIGVRLAVGATERDVRMQFLSEAVLLSLLGGSFGIVLGMAGSVLVSNILGWVTRVSADAVVVAVLFSVGVGIFFGYYPAHKASQLDPIEALRYE